MSNFMDPIRVDGMNELRKALKAAEDASPTMLRLVLNDAAQIIVNVAKPRVPRKTGAAASSMRVASTANKARVQVGGSRAVYYPWLDFGGTTGRNTKRPFIKGGRYLYPAFSQEHANIVKLLDKRLAQLITDAGMDVG